MTEDIVKLQKSIRNLKVILVLVLLLILALMGCLCVGAVHMYKMSQELIPATRKLVEVDWTRMYDQVLKVDPFELKAEMDTIAADLEAIKQSLATFH